jgi:hypothetical protein
MLMPIRKGIPNSLSSVIKEHATDILGVAIGPDSSYWVRYKHRDGGIHRRETIRFAIINLFSLYAFKEWDGLPQQLVDKITIEKPLDVSLGPHGSWFWSNGQMSKRSLHLPLLEAAIKSRLDELPGTLKWVAMGKTSGVALFKDGVRKHSRCRPILCINTAIVLENAQCTLRFNQAHEWQRKRHRGRFGSLISQHVL